MRTWFTLLITGHNKKSDQCNIRRGGQSKLLEAQTHQQYSNNHLINLHEAGSLVNLTTAVPSVW